MEERRKRRGGKFKVAGDLTINAIARQVVLDLEGPHAGVRDPRDGQGGRRRGGQGASRKATCRILYNPLVETAAS